MRRKPVRPKPTLKAVAPLSLLIRDVGRAPCPVSAGPAPRPAGCLAFGLLVCTPSISGQTPAPVMERVTLDEGSRALARNPTVAQAAPLSFAPKGFCNRRVRQRGERQCGPEHLRARQRAGSTTWPSSRAPRPCSRSCQRARPGGVAVGRRPQARDQIDIARPRSRTSEEIASATAQAYLPSSPPSGRSSQSRARDRAGTPGRPERLAGGAGRASMSCGRRRKSPAMKRGWRLRGWPRGERRKPWASCWPRTARSTRPQSRCSRCRPSLTSPPGWRPGRTSSSSPPASEQRNGPRVTASKTTSPQSLRRSILRPSRLAVSFNPREPGA